MFVVGPQTECLFPVNQTKAVTYEVNVGTGADRGK